RGHHLHGNVRPGRLLPPRAGRAALRVDRVGDPAFAPRRIPRAGRHGEAVPYRGGAPARGALEPAGDGARVALERLAEALAQDPLFRTNLEAREVGDEERNDDEREGMLEVDRPAREDRNPAEVHGISRPAVYAAGHERG